MTVHECPLCNESGGDVLFEDVLCRVVMLGGEEGSAYPGYCRVIWTRHEREMSDISASEQRHLLNVVMATERAVRDVQQPDKINLACLGNVVPHIHWHVIPRWKDDGHFPGPIWAPALRQGASRPAVDGEALRMQLKKHLNAGGIT